MRRAGFLFELYEVEYWWFELFEMGRKLMMTSVMVAKASSSENGAFLRRFCRGKGMRGPPMRDVKSSSAPMQGASPHYLARPRVRTPLRTFLGVLGTCRPHVEGMRKLE